MIRERMRIDRFRTWIGMAVLLLAFAVSPAVRVQAAQITIDGDPPGVDRRGYAEFFGQRRGKVGCDAG